MEFSSESSENPFVPFDDVPSFPDTPPEFHAIYPVPDLLPGLPASGYLDSHNTNMASLEGEDSGNALPAPDPTTSETSSALVPREEDTSGSEEKLVVAQECDTDTSGATEDTIGSPQLVEIVEGSHYGVESVAWEEGSNTGTADEKVEPESDVTPREAGVDAPIGTVDEQAVNMGKPELAIELRANFELHRHAVDEIISQIGDDDTEFWSNVEGIPGYQESYEEGWATIERHGNVVRLPYESRETDTTPREELDGFVRAY